MLRFGRLGHVSTSMPSTLFNHDLAFLDQPEAGGTSSPRLSARPVIASLGKPGVAEVRSARFVVRKRRVAPATRQRLNASQRPGFDSWTMTMRGTSRTNAFTSIA